nr:MAG TPA: minor tail protein [Bacteriophage sp.]
MAAGGTDGSLKFDTKINTDGFEEGTGSLLKAAEKLTAAIDNLSTKMDKAFSSSGSAAAATARQVDEVAESARKAREEMERLQKEKAATFTGTITNNNAPASTIPDDGKRYNIYGQDVDAMIAKNRELEESARQASATVTAETQKEENSVVGLKDSLLIAVESFKHFPDNIVAIFQRAGASMDSARTKARTLQDEVDRYQDALYYAGQKGLGLGDPEYDKAYKGLALAKKAAEAYKKSLMGVDNTQKKASKSANKMGGSMKRVRKEAIPLTKSVLKLSNMFKLMLIRMSLRAAIKSAQEGFQNLARYSDETNKSISLLMSANTRLNNSFSTAFAPLLQVAAPALKQMIDLLSTGATYAGQFIAALTGKSTFVKAVDVEEDYAGSLKETNDELKEKEKATKKLAFAFDDLIQAQGGKVDTDAYKPPTPDQMFETVEIEADIKDFAETVKGVLSGLFDPMRQSWDENGSTVIASAKFALNQLKNLGGDVGKTFIAVWDKEGYGKAVTDDLLISVSNLLFTVGNLADGLDQAWKSGDTGLLIMRHLGDLLLEVTGFFRDATGEIKIWSATLDFSPLLKSFDGILVSSRPIVRKIGDILLWLLKDVLLPLAKWGLENGLPAAFDLIAAALDAFDAVLEALKPLAMWLWEEFLQPFGKWTGEVFIKAIEKIVEWLKKFSGWISENQELVEIMATVILGFFAAFKFVEFVTGVKNMLTVLPNLIGVLGGLIGNLNPLTLLLGLIITSAALVAQAWGKMTPQEKLATKIIAVAGAIGLLAMALGTIMHNPMMVSMGGIVAAAAGITAIGIAISALTRGSNASTYSSRAGNYMGQGYNLATQAIPRLATGTVVPPRAGEFAAILGDNNRETEVVSPLSTIEQALDNVMAKYMGGNGGNRQIEVNMYLDRQRLGRVVYKLNNEQKQRVGVRLVTEG